MKRVPLMPLLALPRAWAGRGSRSRRHRRVPAGEELRAPAARGPVARRWRRWALAAALLILPALVYWPAVRERYGFRDDYSILREAREQPGTVLRVCAMQARPLYGVLLESSFSAARTIDRLADVRFVVTIFIGVVAAATFLVLRRMKWDRWTGALVAALIAVVPSAQIAAGWAVSWPLLIAIVFSIAGFLCAERSFEASGSRVDAAATPDGPRAGRRTRIIVWWLAAIGFVLASALTYQPNALYYFTLVAAGLWSRRRWSAMAGVEWLVRHIVTVALGVGMAFTGMMLAFARGMVPVSHRVALESDWLGKLGWFLREPLQNSLALIALNHEGGGRLVHRIAALTAVIIFAGLLRAAFGRRAHGGWWWTVGSVLMVFASFAVNLAVSDRWPVYRVLWPLTATCVVLLAVSLLTLGGRLLARFGLLALLLPGLWLARRQTADLIAWPQTVELNALTEGAAHIDLSAHPRVFVITPSLADHVATRVFRDEFGSLSTNSDWVPKEMMKDILHDRFPAMADVTRRYTLACGPKLPAGEVYDVVIDLRRLRESRPAE